MFKTISILLFCIIPSIVFSDPCLYVEVEDYLRNVNFSSYSYKKKEIKDAFSMLAINIFPGSYTTKLLIKRRNDKARIINNSERSQEEKEKELLKLNRAFNILNQLLKLSN